MDAFVGEIKIWPVPRCPDNWHYCDGTLLTIQNYEVLYSVIGTTYGGNGVTNFALPDLRGRVPIHMGTGPGTNGALPPVAHVIGQNSGSLAVTLTAAQMPAHEHQVLATTNPATTNTPGPTLMLADAGSGASPYMLEQATGKDFTFNALSLSSEGGNSAHNNAMPSRTLNYIICLVGQFPVRP